MLRRPPLALTLVALAVASVFASPIVYLAWQVGRGDRSLVDVVTGDRTFSALVNTLTLATAVAVSAAVLGTALAWLVARSDLPGRRVVSVLAVLPLVFPSFVGALALRSSLAPGGLLEWLLGPLGVDRLPQIEGLLGSWLVLTLFTYPYVLLPVAARLRSLAPSLEESARLLGRSPRQVFTSVVLPQTRTAVAAGTLLVFLYALSDFGVVDLLGFPTLTREIFTNRVLRRDLAMSLGLVLAVLALVVVSGERTLSRRQPPAAVSRGRHSLQSPLGRWRWPAAGAVTFLLANSLVAPVASLGYWAVLGIRNGSVDVDPGALARPALNTAWAGVITAVVAVGAMLPVAILSTRYRSRSAGGVQTVITGSFALPGLVTALALVFLTLNLPVLADWYQTFPVLIVAYVVHFGAQAVRTANVAVAGVPLRLHDAAQMLGASRWRRLAVVDLPLMWPGLAAGGGLVLLSTMKELPATLLLAPIGFETLATDVWHATETSSLAQAGYVSLVLLALSAVLTWLLVVRRAELLD